MNIGVLALQGAFEEHRKALDRLGVNSFEIRQLPHLDSAMDALILPGGESTVVSRLLKSRDLLYPLKEKIEQGLPVFGTCAGLILLADTIEGEDTATLGGISIMVRRNGYGRQIDSFQTVSDFKGIGAIPMRFIRAPYIISCEEGARPLAVVNGKIVAAENSHILVAAFHPELTDDLRVHQYFLNKVKGRRATNIEGSKPCASTHT